MSNTSEHHLKAARHHEQAACHHKEAAKQYDAGEHEKASHEAYLADGHAHHAMHHETEAAKQHADHCDNKAMPASGPVAQKKTAA